MLPLAILAVLFVNADGTGQYPTIQAAVNAAQNGDEVHLEYTGSFQGPGNRDVNLLGKAITICSSDSDSQVWVHPGLGDYDRAFLVDGDATLQNLYLYGWGHEPTITVVGAAPTIIGCSFDDCYAPADIQIQAGADECTMVINTNYNVIQTLPGACVRILEEMPDDSGPSYLSLAPRSWGEVKAAYR